jgi:two-component sensor histidine kinase
VSKAVPLALIINEAITNSMKYAFPDKRPGIVTITMHQHGEQISLLLADNGIGMGDFHKHPKANTLGLELMKGLCKEIHGQIAFTDDFGTKISLIFNQDFPFTRQEKGVILENSEGSP